MRDITHLLCAALITQRDAVLTHLDDLVVTNPLIATPSTSAEGDQANEELAAMLNPYMREYRDALIREIKRAYERFDIEAVASKMSHERTDSLT
jgi:hypothetical protein